MVVSRLIILASGSSGNSALLDHHGKHYLIDCGLPPRVISERLSRVGSGWPRIDAVVLTHTHSDHLHSEVLSHLQRLQIPLWLHSGHAAALAFRSQSFPSFHDRGLTRVYSSWTSFEVGENLHILPVPVPHDSDPTMAFRIDGRCPESGLWWSLGFASDLGEVRDELLDAFEGIRTLAVEFNHDVALQQTSRRPYYLIRRVLSARGHLSNEQAAAFTLKCLLHPDSTAIQLHLSRQCNTPELARAALETALVRQCPRSRLITASQHSPSMGVALAGYHQQMPRPTISSGNDWFEAKVAQPRLPGMD